MKEFLPLTLYIALCLVNIVAMLVLAAVMGPSRKSKNKFTIYECGLEPRVDARQKFNVKFYLTAVIFLLFDIEMVFLIPWAGGYTAALESHAMGAAWRLGEIFLFMGLLALGLWFVYRRKALEWD